MFAVFQKGDGTLVRVDDFDHEVSTDIRTFFFDGAIDGLVQCDYAVDRNVDLHDVVSDLDNCSPKISGGNAGVSIRDGVLEFAASDIANVTELY